MLFFESLQAWIFFVGLIVNEITIDMNVFKFLSFLDMMIFLPVGGNMNLVAFYLIDSKL